MLFAHCSEFKCLYILNVGFDNNNFIKLLEKMQGCSEGGPGVPMTSKQPIIFRGENAMMIMFNTV